MILKYTLEMYYERNPLKKSGDFSWFKANSRYNNPDDASGGTWAKES
jgi:hypothetical protein